MSIDTSDRVPLVFRQVYQFVVDETVFVADFDLASRPADLVPHRTQRWWNRPAVAVGGVALAVLLAVGMVAVLPLGGGQDSVTGPDAPRYPVIEDIETILGPGAELTRTATSLFLGDATPENMVAWAEENETGFDIAIVFLKAQEGSDMARGYANLEGDQTTATGSSGTSFTVTSATQSSPAGVAWSEGTNEFLLFGYGVNPDTLFVEAERMAAGGPVPDEWNDQLPRVYEGTPMLTPPDGIEIREATYQSRDRLLEIDITSFDEWPQSELAALLRSPNAHTVSVGGGDALASQFATNRDNPRTFLMWTGSDSVVGMSGRGLSEQEMIVAAENVTNHRPTYVETGTSFELGYDRIGEADVLAAGDDWEYVGQEVADGSRSGICSWIVVDGGARTESTQCEFPDGSNSTQFRNIARVEAGTLFVGTASNIDVVEITLDNGTTISLETTTFPSFDEPAYFAHVVPWGSQADKISLYDASGEVVFTAPVE